MNFLPPGITGFWSHGDSPPQETSGRDFVSYSHSVAQQLAGKITSITEVSSGYPRNFHAVTLQLPTRTLSVLLNAYHPFLAVAEPLNSQCVYPDFVDCPKVADEFRRFECYRVVSRGELLTLISDDKVAELSAAEKKQLEYWKPKTIGEVMFNSWD